MSNGATRVVTASTMGQGMTLRRTDGVPRQMSAIRSITALNQSAACSVVAYPEAPAGTVPSLYTFPAGSNVTIPTRPLDFVTFLFLPGPGGYDGSITLHIDENSLAASGFLAPVTQPPLLGPNGYSYFIGGALLQWGQFAANADGSTVQTPAFPKPFGVQIFQFTHAIDVGLTDDNFQLVARFFGENNNGFSCVVSGGPPGSFCTVRYMVIGV